MINRFSGDPAVKITPDGAEMLWLNGQPVMDQGFNNAFLISLMTEEGYWGNDLETDESKKIGSDFLSISREPITELDSIANLENSAVRAFAWAKDKQIAQSIEAVVTNPESNYLFTQVKIQPQGQNETEILMLKNGMNWAAQINDPASERMKNV
jgi:phage gp46-like protein